MKEVIFDTKTRTLANLSDIKSTTNLKRISLYSVDEVKKLDKYISGHIQLSNGDIFEMRCDGDSKNVIPGKDVGNVCVVKNPKNGHYQIIDLATEKVVADEVDEIEMHNDHLYSIYSQDYDAFDVIGAIDESYGELKTNGKTLFRSDKPFIPQYKEGKLIGFQCGKSFCAMEKVEEKIKIVEAKQKLFDAIKELKELNFSKFDISIEVNESLEALYQQTIEK